MHDLDRKEFVLAHDPKGMYGYTVDFASQCKWAHEIALAAQIPQIDAKPGCVLLTGLGGSAAGGDFAQALFADHASTSFLVNRDYSLPNFVDADTLTFATSYSGNTEETLSAYEDAKRRGSTIVCLTSGGKLADFARANGDSLITIPAGQPPRTALGYMLIPVIVACERLGLLPSQNYGGLVTLLDACAKAWSIEQPVEGNHAKQLAIALHGALGVIYGLGSWQAIVANRWKGQINENAKNMVFANAFPELCHNEILGWVKADEQGVQRWVGILLEDGTESAKMQARATVTAKLIGGVCTMHRTTAQGASLLEKMLSLALLGDFVSLYLAALNGVDPENIDSINVLKAELARVE